MIIDASVLDHIETHKIIRDDIKQNRIEYIFPDGFNQVDLIEECRALTMLDDFDTMYDLTMQMLVGKPIAINIKNLDGSKTELCSFQVVDRYQNLRGVEVIDEYPWLVTWLTELTGAAISAKITEAWEKSVAAVGSKEIERQADPFNTGEKVADNGDSYIVKTYFGDELLYACYGFYDRFKNKPSNWLEVFEFLHFMKVQGMLKAIAMTTARTSENG